ncbi:MAG: hypothetical protein NDI75_01205 [Candidatus Didemnitutus sp.]|nr:hypothetical protein [Candidatus Didemnitutus sp.]
MKLKKLLGLMLLQLAITTLAFCQLQIGHGTTIVDGALRGTYSVYVDGDDFNASIYQLNEASTFIMQFEGYWDGDSLSANAWSQDNEIPPSELRDLWFDEICAIADSFFDERDDLVGFIYEFPEYLSENLITDNDWATLCSLTDDEFDELLSYVYGEEEEGEEEE